MNKIYKTFFILILGLILTECTTTDSTSTIALNDFTVQKDTDDAKIITYLKTHKLNTPITNFDVQFTAVASGDPECIWVKNQAQGATYPLLTRICTANSVSCTIYYLILQQGGASTPSTTRKPCNLDGVFTSYKGRLMDDFVPAGTLIGGIATTVDTGGTSTTDVGTVFDFNNNPIDYFNLDGVIRGWAEIFPLFNTGSNAGNPDGTNTYNDFGAGVMFLPSGLAYFNGAPGIIPAYSPLIFSFKLYEIRRNDHDYDGIYDFEEDIYGGFDKTLNLPPDRYIYTSATNGGVTDDSDGDGYPDAYDQDDDNDNFNTKNERKRPPAISGYQTVNGIQYPIYVYDSNGAMLNTGYYPFQSNLPDNLSTPYVYENQGVPDCSGDFVSIGRNRKYLDAGCH